MTFHEYTAPVTRMEVFEVSDRVLNQERIFRMGQADRKNRRPCASANGCYLNGYYNPELACYYVSKFALHLV